MFRLAWMSDIHVNFLDPLSKLYPPPESALEPEDAALALRIPTGFSPLGKEVEEAKADAVLMTGDITEGQCLRYHLPALQRLFARPLYFVLGNHDYYQSGIVQVKALVRSLCVEHSSLHWLEELGVVMLTPSSGLLGVDVFYDMRLGAAETTTLQLNDFIHIKELSGLTRAGRRRYLHALADAAVANFKPRLEAACEKVARLIIGTHVPPFAESACHGDTPADPDFLPYFSCHALGALLRDTLPRFPNCQCTVLCGHTHAAQRVQILPNLDVWTAGAEYYEPSLFAVLELP